LFILKFYDVGRYHDLSLPVIVPLTWLSSVKVSRPCTDKLAC